MKEKPLKVLYKAPECTNNRLTEGWMTLTELYKNNDFVTIWNADLEEEHLVSRRHFHIVDDQPVERDKLPPAIVYDIDGVMNYVPEVIVEGGISHRQSLLMKDGSHVQWTEVNKAAQAKVNRARFRLLGTSAKDGNKIIFLTARGDTQRLPTEEFLKRGFEEVGMGDTQFTLFMRGFSANDLSAPEMKAHMLQACILPFYNVLTFADDCPKNIKCMKEACPSVPTWHVETEPHIINVVNEKKC